MDGVIVGVDQTLEWILPWWIKNYLKYNDKPVAFIDLGLSFEKKDWCKKQGTLIPLRVVDFAEEPPLEYEKKWEEESGKQFKESRSVWFKKPFACLKSPFERTLWIDIDCEIRGSLIPLFEYADDFGMCVEKNEHNLPYPLYNSGVIAFQKNHPLLALWQKAALEENRYFRGDQELLSHLIHRMELKIREIPPIYNWSRMNLDDKEAKILHWHGNHGKFVIRNQL